MFQSMQIDLTKLGRIVREHPDAVKKVQFKDGEHTIINGTIITTKFPTEYRTEIMSVKPKDVTPQSNDEWRYWEIGSTKLQLHGPQTENSAEPTQSVAPSASIAPTPQTEVLPF